VTRGLPRIAEYSLPHAGELPANRVPWLLDRRRAALLVHDMQHYFVDAFTPGVSPITDVIANIDVIRRSCDESGVPVFYTAQPGAQHPDERGLQSDFWGPGMTSLPEHRAIVETLAPLPHHTILTKWRYSAFQRSPLEEMLRSSGRDQLIVTGVYASIGCLLTAADAFMRDVEPFIVADAIADFTRARHDDALRFAVERCASLTTTVRLLGDL